MKLGLILRGGVRFVLEVDMAKHLNSVLKLPVKMYAVHCVVSKSLFKACVSLIMAVRLPL